MSRELFSVVRRRPETGGFRRWSTVPLSVGAHAVAAALLVGVPLLATGTLPAPHEAGRLLLVTPAPPPPPPPPPIDRPAAAPSAEVSRVSEVDPTPVAVTTTPVTTTPVSAPAGIGKEAWLAGRPRRGIESGPARSGLVSGFGTLTQPAPRSTAPVRVGGRVQAPTRLAYQPPRYPVVARRARIEGVVVLEATVDEAGRVAGVRVLRSVPMLDQAAVEAVRRWVYSPTRLNGTAVSVLMTVTVRFQLD